MDLGLDDRDDVIVESTSTDDHAAAMDLGLDDRDDGSVERACTHWARPQWISVWTTETTQNVMRTHRPYCGCRNGSRSGRPRRLCPPTC